MNSTNPEESQMEPSLNDSQAISDGQNQINKKASATTTDVPSFGWSEYAERVNGRFAMIGFIAILLIEVFSSSGFLHWAGLIP